jgi:hypothetical protein
MFIHCCPLIYAILQGGCCRNFIYRCEKCCLVAFRGVGGPRGVTAKEARYIDAAPNRSVAYNETQPITLKAMNDEEMAFKGGTLKQGDAS